ncbi:MAG: hypothetical protein J0L93_02480 [Deltaproteobacteria bacterium]|nr:hypothetical protein [Deltaproteobacteria bacterium]
MSFNYKFFSEVFLGLLILSFSSAFAGADILEKIEIVGNTKTDSFLIEKMTDLEIGQELTNALIENAKANVSSSGVFESVNVENKPGSDMGHRILVFYVKEKITWFIVPAFSFSQTDLAFGLVAGETNLFGLMKKLAIFSDYSSSAKRLAGGYRDNGMFGTHITLSVDGILRTDDMAEFTDRKVVRRVRVTEYGGTFLPGYRLHDNVVASLGVYFRHVQQRLRFSEPAQDMREPVFKKGKDIAMVAEIEFKNTRTHNGLSDGTEIKLSSQFSDERYFSDFDYNKQLIYITHGINFWNEQANSTTRGSIQLGKNLPYYIELMAGGTNLRGFLSRQFRGDTKYAWGQEFMLPIYDFSRFILRTNLFWDSTIIYFKKDNEGNGDGFSRQKWHNGLGGGFRIYLKGVAVPLFGYDMAWGIEDRAYGYYLSVGAIF